MTIEQFKALEPDEQRKELREHLSMGARSKGNITVNFYKLDGFYIEEYFNPNREEIY